MGNNAQTSAGGAGPTAPTIAEQVWTYAGRALDTIANIVTGVWSSAARTLTGPDNLTDDGLVVNNSRIDAAITTRSSHTANNVRDAILDDATRFSGASIATILADVMDIESHLHAINYTLPALTVVRAPSSDVAADTFGPWQLLVNDAELSTYISVGQLFDPGLITIKNATPNRIFVFQLGYGDGTPGGTTLMGGKAFNTNGVSNRNDPINITCTTMTRAAGGGSAIYIRCKDDVGGGTATGCWADIHPY